MSGSGIKNKGNIFNAIAIFAHQSGVIMKSISLLLVIVVFIAHELSAQKVFSVDYSHQSDVKVFVVKYEHKADLKVFKVPYEHNAGTNDGKWFFVKYAHQAEKKIFFVEYEHQADLKIFFVKYEHQAGWRNKSKMHVMY